MARTPTEAINSYITDMLSLEEHIQKALNAQLEDFKDDHPQVTQELRGFTAKTRQEDLATLHDLMTSGAVTPVIDRCFPLSDVSQAIRYLEAGHARGKVIITVE